MTTKRKYRMMMELSEWEVPKLKVGDLAIVLYRSGPPNCSESRLLDTCASTVVEIRRTGSVILANGYKFHANGLGHSCNNNMVISKHHAIDRDKNGNPRMIDGEDIPATFEGHYSLQ